MNERSIRRASAGRGPQRGVVLIVAMVMLVIIGLMSVSVMRGALNADLVANNARAQTSAMQSAQIALRYCERNLGDDTKVPEVIVQNAPSAPGTTNWETFSKWFPATSRTAVPMSTDIMKSADSSFMPAFMPECMAEKAMLEDGVTEVYIVTARGFSPDYQQDGTGKATAGSVVWVQSTLGFH
ncbi:hypothetical protein LRH25_17395 [Ideonella azotifigens]|uniref:Type 4 fimbrial biogenesis protein PilX N-terminal domain-containing protein n=1 Tax=Ideonella azotifigens TaxID=513160 RepID=A0ABP3VDZ4_9BURK|nr:hypothetical protein [Ideonella azotifigens]MCD2342116.1 hypothetical protein [Ideonella azotifigens]